MISCVEAVMEEAWSMRLLGSVSTCKGIMLLKLSMAYRFVAIRNVHLKAVESTRSSPDLTRWGIQVCLVPLIFKGDTYATSSISSTHILSAKLS